MSNDTVPKIINLPDSRLQTLVQDHKEPLQAQLRGSYFLPAIQHASAHRQNYESIPKKYAYIFPSYLVTM
jgi:type VI protein secretion system component VasK